MRVIIVGAGMVGTQLARHLVNEKHDVSLIEQNEERARHASNRLDCLVLHNEGNNLKSLEEAGLASADALVCVTDVDEVNMLICGLAESRYPGILKIARVRNAEYDSLIGSGSKALGIDYFVHPDIEAARSVLSAVEHGALGDILTLGDSSYELGSVDIEESCPFAGTMVRDFRNLVKGDSLVTLIERGDESLLPTGATSLLVGDRIHVIALEEELGRVFSLAGKLMKPLKKIGIVGGGRVGSLIAEGLFKKDQKKNTGLRSFLKILNPRSFRKLMIIEKDYSLCKELSSRFPEALVLNENISEESFISEEGIDDLDLIITATSDQELNMIAALYLKSRGVDRAVAMVSGSGYAAIARRLGIDVVIPMKSVVVDSILSHLLGSGVRGIHRISDGGIEVLEIDVGEHTLVAGRRLDEFRLAAGGLVMLVHRSGKAFIPKGDYVFTGGDRIVLIAKKGCELEIDKLFGSYA